MGDFLTPAELTSYLQIPTVDTTTANLLIGMAEASVRSYCGWNITEATVTNGVVEPDGCHIFLPTTHLTAVTNVTDAGTVYTPGTAFRWTRGGLLTRTYGRWSCVFGAVTATYTHGYAAGAGELTVVKDVVASIVSRKWQNPGGTRSETIGGTAEVYAIPASGIIPAGLLYSEMEALGAFRIVAVA